MNNQEAYNVWSQNYDTVENKTRDIEASAFREILSKINFTNVLEIGCGTGKNTEWLVTKAQSIIGIDFSDEMLNKAKSKIKSFNVEFQFADIRKEWNFKENSFDLVTCSLVLEHIQNINFIFEQAKKVLIKGGIFFIGELHPFKQYQGSKARFDKNNSVFELECFIHNISDFFAEAMRNKFEYVSINEWFDDNNETAIPRLITMVFRNI